LRLHAPFVLALGFFITACSTATKYSIKMPPNSVAFEQPALANNIAKITSQYIAQKYDCNDWSLLKVLSSEAHGQLVFTQEGQLYQGAVTEQWQLSQCDTPLTLQLKMQPEPSGGITVKIRRLN